MERQRASERRPAPKSGVEWGQLAFQNVQQDTETEAGDTKASVGKPNITDRHSGAQPRGTDHCAKLQGA